MKSARIFFLIFFIHFLLSELFVSLTIQNIIKLPWIVLVPWPYTHKTVSKLVQPTYLFYNSQTANIDTSYIRIYIFYSRILSYICIYICIYIYICTYTRLLFLGSETQHSFVICKQYYASLEDCKNTNTTKLQYTSIYILGF